MSTLLSAAQRLREGSPVLVGDAGEDTIFIAAAATNIAPEQLAQLHGLGHGTVVVGMSAAVAERLQLPTPEAATAPSEPLTLMTPIDAARGTEGGWSLHDRALTMRVAADPGAGPGALRAPGHVLVGHVSPGARGPAAASLELAQLAGLEPVVALIPILDPAGRVARWDAVTQQPRFDRMPRASSHELNELADRRQACAHAVTCELPTRDGRFRAVALGDQDGERVPVAFVHGDPQSAAEPFVHVHVACRLGDAFGSLLCDCRTDLDDTINRIIAIGSGVIVYAPSPDPCSLECSYRHGFDEGAVNRLVHAIGLDRARTQRSTPKALAASAAQLEAHA